VVDLLVSGGLSLSLRSEIKTYLAAGLFVFTAFCLMLTLAYWPVITACYGVSDDFMFLSQAIAQKEWTAIWRIKLALGRPLLAVLHAYAFSQLHSISDLSCLRWLGICIVSLLSASCYLALLAAGWRRLPAFLWSLAAFTLPPFQVYAGWATTGFQPLAGVLAGASWYVADTAFDSARLRSKYGLAVASVVLLVLALFTYQPAAMFFWCFAAIALFKANKSMSANKTIGRLAWYSGVFAPGVALSVAVWKACLLLMKLPLTPGRSKLADNLFEKATWFVQQPLTDALNLARLVPSQRLALAVSVFTAIGLLLYFRGNTRQRLFQLAIAAAIIPLTYLPNLVVSESWATYRTKSALTILIALYALFALHGYLRVLPDSFANLLLVSTLGIVAPVFLYVAATQVRDYFTVPQQLELKLLREHVASNPAVSETIKHMHMSPREAGLAPLTRYDEFGILSVAQQQATKPLLSLILRETRRDRVSRGPGDNWR